MSKPPTTSQSNTVEDVNRELQRLLGITEEGDPMKFEDYIEFCLLWVPLYLSVWEVKCWHEDWVKKGLAEHRPPFFSQAEEIERTWSSFEDFNEIGSGELVRMYQMISLAQIGLRMASDICKANKQDASDLAP